MGRSFEAEVLGRRRALGFFASAGAAFAFGCSGSSEDDTAADDADSGGDVDAGSASAEAGDCTATPEGEIGPYFADDSDARFERSNILSNLDGTSTQTGVPLTLTVFVLDAQNACAAYVGAQVDIWHCNSEGVYSDEASQSTTSERWLRGYQITDASGKVSFTTIIPGWYSGRTKHIHLRIRSTYSEASSTSDGTNTTQLFFPQSVDDTIDVDVYKEGQNPTTNVGDHVYSGEENGANVLAVSGDTTSGYAAAVTIFLPIAAAT
jgi:protocatechuate 3,4-dioxygenase beta subunit